MEYVTISFCSLSLQGVPFYVYSLNRKVPHLLKSKEFSLDSSASVYSLL